LNPKIKKCAWSREEEQILFLLHRKLDNKWAEIARVLEGRTDNTIKNHWNSSMKKKLPDMERKLNQFIAQSIHQRSQTQRLSHPETSRIKEELEGVYLKQFIDQVKAQNKQYFWWKAVALMRKQNEDFSRSSLNLLFLST
jgi:hypothetical protein